MKTKLSFYKHLIVVLLGLFLISANTLVIAGSHGKSSHRNKIPDDFNKMLVYVSSSPFISVDGSFLVDGMVQGDGLNFHSNVMGRSEEEIEASKQAAFDFFLQRFGLNAASSDVYFTGFEATPDIKYHVAFSSGDYVPPEGWRVNDGGWILAVVNPAGVDLGGEFAGTHVPAGTMFVMGNYKIERKSSGKHKKGLEPIVIDYKSRKPILVESDGSFAVSCELYNEHWGEGQAIGATLPIFLNDGRMVYNTRNVLTFPPFGIEVEPLR